MPQAKESLTRERTRLLRSAQARSLRAWRVDDAQLSREELAVQVGLSVRSVQRMEHGESSLRVDVVYLLEEIKPGLVRRLFPQEGYNLLENAATSTA